MRLGPAGRRGPVAAGGFVTSVRDFIKKEQALRKYPSELAKRLVTNGEGLRAFVLAWPKESGSRQPIVLSQRDIRELQFAKGSIASGIEAVMNEMGVTQQDLVKIYLAGFLQEYYHHAPLLPPLSLGLQLHE